MQRDLHAGGTQVAAALTLAVLTTALGAPLVGRWLDAHGGRALMSAGSVLGTVAVLAWSQVTSLLQLYGVFVTIGIASAMVLYEPAFAVVISWFDGPGNEQGRANALLALTVVAGFASSIFLPLSGLLVEQYGWRQALVVLAIGYGILAIPLHALILRRRIHLAWQRTHHLPRLGVNRRAEYRSAALLVRHADSSRITSATVCLAVRAAPIRVAEAGPVQSP